MRYVYLRFSRNCYPCTTRESYNFCPGDMDYGYTTRLVFHLGSFFSCLFVCSNIQMTLFPFYFSFFTVCGLSYCVSVPFDLPFCTKMWAYKCVGFHWNLFINGISLGTSFELLMDFNFILFQRQN